MVSPELLIAQSQALMTLLNDQRYQDKQSQTLIATNINTLAWVNDGEAATPSENVAAKCGKPT